MRDNYVIAIELGYANGIVELTEYVSNKRYTTLPTDSPANLDFKVRLAGDLNLNRTANISTLSRRASGQVISQIELMSDISYSSQWSARVASDRTVIIKRGVADAAYSKFELVATLNVLDVKTTDTRVLIEIEDGFKGLENDVSPSLYESAALASRVDNPDLWKMKRKVVLGSCAQVGMDLMSPSQGFYSISDKPLEQIGQIHKDDAQLNPLDWAVSTGADVFGVTMATLPVVPGQYVAQQVIGNFIGAAPGGRSTKQFTGLAIEILRRGGIPESRIDTASFNAIQAVFGGNLGMAMEGPVSQWLELLFASVGGGWWINYDGKIHAGSILVAGVPTGELDLESLVGEVTEEWDEAPGLATRVLFDINWAPVRSDWVPTPAWSYEGQVLSANNIGILNSRYLRRALDAKPIRSAWRAPGDAWLFLDALIANYQTLRKTKTYRYFSKDPAFLPFQTITIDAASYLVLASSANESSFERSVTVRI